MGRIVNNDKIVTKICLLSDFSGLVVEALLLANFDAAVEVCIHHNRMAEAIVLAIAGGPELLTRTQNRFFKSQNCSVSRVSCHCVI